MTAHYRPDRPLRLPSFAVQAARQSVMPTIYDLAYRTLLVLGSPVLLFRGDLRNKLARALRERNGQVPSRQGARQCLLIHAVSVGEVNATQALVTQLLEHDASLDIVISVTTDTGLERAQQLFNGRPGNGRVSIVSFPLDLTRFMRRFLDSIRPDLAVLMEGDVWPNFVLECSRRTIPVVLVNARQTERAHRQYRMIRPFISRIYSRFAAVCAQEKLYADRLIALGVPADRMRVTGTMKFDSAQLGERVEGDEQLARELGLKPHALGGDEPVLVCGSTGPGEETRLLDAHRWLFDRHPRLRIVIVPRKPERFDEVAQELANWGHVLRRSSTANSPSGQPKRGGRTGLAVEDTTLILGDTMGELRKFYSLADIVIVGRTLLDLGEKQHGSDMIEPAALGKPIVVGPWTGNFAEPMRALLAADAVRQIDLTPRTNRVTGPAIEPIVDKLVEVVDKWLHNPAEAAAVGRRAREVVLANRGATQRNVQVILDHLRSRGQ